VEICEMNRTHSAKSPQERKWYVVDAAGKPVGRIATRIAEILRGKHKPVFTPHVDMGDFVVVVNAEKVALTGRKLDQKMYRRHSGYPGGLTEHSARWVLEQHPERVIESAVRGMLPKNRLSRQVLRKLKVYAGGDHPHEAQKPEVLEI
jgi:large subunit ribosomal protein L13